MMHIIPNRHFITRPPKGTHPYTIAAHMWFPIESDPIPTMIKLKEEATDEIITIKTIRIISCEYILYLGDNMIEYHCQIQLPDNRLQEVYIHYYIERMRFTLSMP